MTPAQTLLIEGAAHVQAGRWSYAINPLRESIALAPDWESLGYLGIALHNIGDLDGSIDAYRKSLALRKHRDVFLNFALALRDKGDLQGAFKIAQEASELFPQDVAILELLAARAADAGRQDVAALAFQNVDAINGRPSVVVR